jgi:hypothetical protein
MDIVTRIHPPEIRRVVRDEHVALALHECAKLRILRSQHGPISIAGGPKAKLVGHLHERRREILVEPELHA